MLHLIVSQLLASVPRNNFEIRHLSTNISFYSAFRPVFFLSLQDKDRINDINCIYTVRYVAGCTFYISAVIITPSLWCARDSHSPAHTNTNRNNLLQQILISFFLRNSRRCRLFCFSSLLFAFSRFVWFITAIPGDSRSKRRLLCKPASILSFFLSFFENDC